VAEVRPNRNEGSPRVMNALIVTAGSCQFGESVYIAYAQDKVVTSARPTSRTSRHPEWSSIQTDRQRRSWQALRPLVSGIC